MGYNVKFDNGLSVTFDTPPTEADIEEAYAHVSKQQTSGTAAFGKSAVESTLPSLGGLAGGVAAISYGAPLIAGASAVPVAGPVLGPVTALGLGLTGAYGGSTAVEKMQEAATSLVPETMKERFGFGKQQRELETQQNPNLSFAGRLAPNLLAFRPGAVAPIVDAAGKQIMGANAQRLAMGGIGGGIEAGSQLLSGQPLDPAHIAMASIVQGVATNPTAFGRKFMGRFEAPTAAKSKADAMEQQQKDLDVSTAPTGLPEQFAGMTKESPMDRMTRDLGGEPFAPAEEFTPMSQMAKDLTTERSTPEQRRAQDILDERQKQMEFEVARTARPELNAAELQRREAAPTGYQEHLSAQEEAAKVERQRRDSELAQAAGAGEQASLFEPHANMHRAYEEVFAQTPEGVRPFSFNEFKETLQNLAKEPGTAFNLPEDMKAAYQDYLNHPGGGQGDLFGAHAILQATSHRNWGDLTPQEKAAATKALNKIGPISEAMTERMSLQEATGQLLDVLMSKNDMNLLPDDRKLLPAVLDFARALFDAGYKTLAEAMAHANQVLGEGWQAVADKLADAFKVVRSEQILSGETIPDNTPAEQIIKKAVGEKDSNVFTYLQSGSTLTAMKTNSTIIRDVGRIVQNGTKKADLAIRNFIFPIEKSLGSMNSKELVELHEIFKKEAFSNKAFDSTILEQNLSIKQLEAYSRIREMYDDTLAAQNVVRQSKGQPLVSAKEAYMSSRWQGAFRQPVRDANGHLAWYLASDSKIGIKAQADALLKQMPELMVDYAEGHSVSLQGNKTDLQSAYTTMLDIAGRDDPVVLALKKAVEEQTVMETEFTLAQTKHFKKKSNIRGFVGDRPGYGGLSESLAFFEEQIQYGKNAYNWTEMQKAGDIVKDVLANPVLRDEQPNNIKYAREYFKNALGQGQSQVTRAIEDSLRKGLGTTSDAFSSGIGKAKSYFILDKLSVSAGFTLTQFIQLGSILPYLTDLRAKGYKGNPVTAVMLGAPTGMAMGFAHYLKSTGHEYMNKLPDQFTKDMFLYAEENGVTTRSVYDESQLSSNFGLMGKAANALSKTLTVPDAFTRGVAFATYAHMLKSSGMYKDQIALFQKAEELVNTAMVDYRQTERPMVFSKLGTAGNALNTLQTYPMNFYNQYTYFIGEATKGNYGPLLAAIGVQYLTAGAMGVPYIEDTNKLFTWIKDNALPADVWASMEDSPFLRDPKTWAIDTFGRSSVYGALSETTGLGLTSRVAAPGVGGMLQAPGGPAIDVAKQAVSAGKALMDPTSREKTAQAVMNILPSGVQGAYEMAPANAGITYQQRPGGRVGVFKTTDIGNKDVAFVRTPEEVELRRMTGLKSQREVVERDLTYQANKELRLYNEKGGELVNMAVVAQMKGDMKRFGELNKLYTRLKGEPITNDQIFKKAMEKAMTDKESMMLKAANGTNARQLIEAARLRNRLEAE
jgi:hypothetical protein